MTDEHIEFWSGGFGDAYTDRNQVDWSKRVPFWSNMIWLTQPSSVLEVGCNAGWNLMAIESVDKKVILSGVEINEKARLTAIENGFPVEPKAGHEIGSLLPHDMVFTAGVLIHVSQQDLGRTMRAIVDNSARYVLAIEYADTEEVEVEYRGHSNKLWRRPYGELYQEFGLRLVSTGEAEGFDDCTYWLLEKQ